MCCRGILGGCGNGERGKDVERPDLDGAVLTRGGETRAERLDVDGEDGGGSAGAAVAEPGRHEEVHGEAGRGEGREGRVMKEFWGGEFCKAAGCKRKGKVRGWLRRGRRCGGVPQGRQRSERKENFREIESVLDSGQRKEMKRKLKEAAARKAAAVDCAPRPQGECYGCAQIRGAKWRRFAYQVPLPVVARVGAIEQPCGCRARFSPKSPLFETAFISFINQLNLFLA